MAEYTYAQIAQMQKEAEQRVKEMRLRAKLAAEDAHRRFDADDKNECMKEEMHSEQNTTVFRKPKSIQMESGLKGQRADLSSSAEGDGENVYLPSFLQIKSKRNRFVGDLNADSDRALLLSLLFLLQAEKADDGLMLALLYLLG